ncbi:MAG: threonine ammonia-lyase [Nocardioides sp.]|uniref:threonine ammonia-lyase n=1 Tax=Nocardioides sp. TaxID=35761 RepID=UPI0039E264DA
MTEVPTVSLADIQAAAGVLDGVVARTPTRNARWLAERLGGDVRLKLENLQRTGSFKPRGAYLRLSRLSDAERAAGVVAASAGNHAQGVAMSAQRLGISSTIFMPEGAPIPKVNATRGYGAEVVFRGQYLDQAIEAAQEFAAETGAVFISPFDHPDIVAGQGTCGLEILEQAPEVRTLVVPTGGGGLLAGIAIAVKALRPDIRVIGVQAEAAAAFPPSLAAGHPIRLEAMRTMADGIAVGRPGDITFRAVQEHVDEIKTVSEDSLARALVTLLERSKQVVEPAGAAAVAAMATDPDAFETPAVAVVSGGNIDPLLLNKVVRHGLAAAGRYLYLGVVISDLPGGLAGLLTEVAALGASVIDLSHERISADLALNEVEIGLQLETRGAEHATRLRARLEELGYRIVD